MLIFHNACQFDKLLEKKLRRMGFADCTVVVNFSSKIIYVNNHPLKIRKPRDGYFQIPFEPDTWFDKWSISYSNYKRAVERANQLC